MTSAQEESTFSTETNEKGTTPSYQNKPHLALSGGTKKGLKKQGVKKQEK